MIKKRIKSNSAVVGTVEFLGLIVFIFFIFLWILDFGIYFNNRNIVINSAQNGARLASVFGGSGATPIYKQYGKIPGGAKAMKYTKAKGNRPVERAVFHELDKNKGLIMATVKEIECGPSFTENLGDRVYCKITWYHSGFGGLLRGTHTVTVSAESEVIHKNKK